MQPTKISMKNGAQRHQQNSDSQQSDHVYSKEDTKQKYTNELFSIQKFTTDTEEEDLESFDSLEFNALLYKTSQSQQKMIWQLFQKNGWLKKYNIELEKFVRFLNILEYKYNKKNNPFHKFQHGLAVMQGTHAICLSEVVQDILDEFDIFTLVFSGLCHDVSHPAYTNIFAIDSLSKLAIRYHDESPLEQHHAATTFKILLRTDLFGKMDKDKFKNFRKNVIQNIMYTDNSRHQYLYSNFQERFYSSPEKKSAKLGRAPEDRAILQGYILHTADFSGSAQVFDVSREWSERVNKEFSKQYEMEGQLGLKQTPIMKDVHILHIMAKAEIGFFKFFVLPLWNQLDLFLNGYLGQNVKNLKNTVEKWQQIQEQQQKEQQSIKDQ